MGVRIWTHTIGDVQIWYHRYSITPRNVDRIFEAVLELERVMDIVKAVIPAAGIGSRFLPYTATIPKEMLPILNKPAIQYIVEEGLNSAINQFIMVTSR